MNQSAVCGMSDLDRGAGLSALKERLLGVESQLGLLLVGAMALAAFRHKDRSDLLFGFPDLFPVPVSRWNVLSAGHDSCG